jgi:arginine N-succinyltransferase
MGAHSPSAGGLQQQHFRGGQAARDPSTIAAKETEKEGSLMGLIVREVSTTDLDALWELIGQANTGMTSLKIDREQLADRIERAHFAFRRTMEKPEGAPYVFVMEDLESKRLVGTSCVFSKTGGFEPFYAYRILHQQHHCELLEQTQEIRSLHLVKIHNGPTELGGLFLLPEYRGTGGGKLLSMSRFLYIAAHPKRFANETIAEMRGYLDANDESPFWNAIGSHFFQVDFPRADALSMIDKQFIEDLMPHYPIYLELLPQAAIAAIGQVHAQTRPALAMLETQGFVRRDMVDIFDGGPVVHCRTADIRGVRGSKRLPIDRITDPIARPIRAIVAVENPRFCATIGVVDWIDDVLQLPQELAERLNVAPGDSVWIQPLS